MYLYEQNFRQFILPDSAKVNGSFFKSGQSTISTRVSEKFADNAGVTTGK